MSIIKKLRAKLGLSQKEFAKKLGVSQSAASHWERGVTQPNIKIAFQMSKLAARAGHFYSPEELREVL